MNIGTLYYVSTLVGRISSLSEILVAISIFSVISGVAFYALFIEMDDKHIKKIKLRVVKISCVVLVFSSIVKLVIPGSQKEFLSIVVLNSVDEKIIQNEDVREYVFKKMQLVDKKLDELLHVEVE